jgi:hypothetical protein
MGTLLLVALNGLFDEFVYELQIVNLDVVFLHELGDLLAQLVELYVLHRAFPR